MNVNGSSVIARPPVSRRRRYLVAILLAGIALVGGAYYWLLESSNRQIHEAEAEADRLDPGWKFADLLAARAVTPDKENSALHVLAARELLPHNWQKWTNPPPVGPGLVESLEDLSPEIKLSEKELQGLAGELQMAEAAIEEAKRVAGMPRGRYAVKWSKDAVGTPLPHLDAARQIARLLHYDAVLRAEKGDSAGARASVEAAIDVGRSLGDEPSTVAQFTRLYCSRQALIALERILAQGELGAKELESLQLSLEEEANHPAQVISIRGERAMVHQFLLVAENMGIDRAGYALRASPLGYRFDNIVDMMKAKRVHAAYLRFLTRCVEIAKLPAYEQESKFAELGLRPVQGPQLLEGLSRGEEPKKMRKIFHSTTAYLRSAIVALALERYRRAEGRWPNDLNALVPKYLPSVPVDPFEGKPFQWIRTKEAAGEFWTIRPAKIREEDKIFPSLSRQWDSKYFRLWDVKERRQAAADIDTKKSEKQEENLSRSKNGNPT